MPNIIMADPKGGKTPDGAYVKFYSKVCTIEENNNVTNTENYQSYLMTLSGLPGVFMAFSALEPIVSPVNNDIANAKINSQPQSQCYRYRNGAWGLANWNYPSYDAVAVPGRKVVVHTIEIVVPT